MAQAPTATLTAALLMGWFIGWAALFGVWTWSMAQGDDAGRGFTVLVIFGGGAWAVIGAVATVSGLSLRALWRDDD